MILPQRCNFQAGGLAYDTVLETTINSNIFEFVVLT